MGKMFLKFSSIVHLKKMERQDRTAIIGRPGQDSKESVHIARIGRPKKVQDRMGYAEHGWQNRT
jgi:hypothetical protein